MKTLPIYTRSDLDGMLGCAILKEAGYNGQIEFVNPLDILSGSCQSPEKCVRVNLPGPCESRWDRNTWGDEVPGQSPGTACEGILETLNEAGITERFSGWLEELEKWQSHRLSPSDFSAPSSVLMLAVVCDPVTGLGRYRDFVVSNYFFLLDLIDQLRIQQADALIQGGDVRDRLDLLASRKSAHEEQMRRTLRGTGPLLIQDMREEYRIEPGNPMIKHLAAPPHEAILTLFWDKNRRKVSVVLSGALNQTPPVHLGTLLQQYGGGGDRFCGVAQVLPDQVESLMESVRKAVER